MKRFLFLLLIFVTLISGVIVFNACGDNSNVDEITLDTGSASIGEVTFETQDDTSSNKEPQNTTSIDEEKMEIDSDKETGFGEIYPVE